MDALKSAEFLRGLNYVLCRLQELKAYGLISSNDLFEKAMIAQSIGYEKDLPQEISLRITQLFDPNNKPVEPVGFEIWLKKLLQEHHVSNVIRIIQSSLVPLVKKQKDKVDKLADESTYLLLSEMYAILKRGEAKIGASLNFSTDFELDSLSKQVSTEKVSFGEIAELPGRPEEFTYNPNKDCNLEACAHSELELAKFIHFIAVHIEVCAMEVCSFNILKYPELPMQFRTDMAQQIWDESRHFLIFAEYLKNELNTEIGAYPYQLDVWFKHQKGDGVLEQLAIEQILQEGDAVSNNIRLINGLKSLGKFPKLQELMTFINADETVHTRIGNKWLVLLCEEQNKSYLQVLQSAADKIGKKIPSDIQIKPKLLNFLGFPPEYQSHIDHS